MDCFECGQIRGCPANARLSTTSRDYGENVQMNLAPVELRECPEELDTRATECADKVVTHVSVMLFKTTVMLF